MAEPTSEHYVIRVSSAAPSQDASVLGAIYLSGSEAGVHLVDRRTPFEIAGPARIVSGMLQAADPARQILVEVLHGDGVSEPKRVTMARGRAVLLGERLVAESARFIRTAP